MKILKAAALAIILGFLSLSTHAATVNVTPCAARSCATSITGLSAGGMTFDVNFLEGAFDTLYPDPTVIPFWNDQTMATTAAQAMIDAVRAVGGIGGCAGAFCVTDLHMGFAKPTATSVDLLDANISNNTISVLPNIPSALSFVWADFTKVTAMPEPGTLWMGLLGFSVIAWIRWSIPN